MIIERGFNCCEEVSAVNPVDWNELQNADKFPDIKRYRGVLSVYVTEDDLNNNFDDVVKLWMALSVPKGYPKQYNYIYINGSIKSYTQDLKTVLERRFDKFLNNPPICPVDTYKTYIEHCDSFSPFGELRAIIRIPDREDIVNKF